MNKYIEKDQWSILWLVIAAFLLLLANGRWIVPVAAWLYPIFMVRFFRTQRPARGLAVGYLVMCLVAIVQWKGLVPASPVIFYQIVPALALGVVFAFGADRLIAPRLGGFLSTLPLPLAWVSIEYILARTNPFGTWAFTAYTQFPNLRLLQVVSVTGMSGVTFLMAWFASVANWIWEKDFDWKKTRAGILLYAAILTSVLIGGGLRLILFPPPAGTVRTASLTGERNEIHSDAEVVKRLLATGELTASELEVVRAHAAASYDKLFERSLTELRAGAKIILWPEGAVFLLRDDEDSFLNRARELAESEGAYLALAVATIIREPEERQQGKPIENKVFLVDPKGEIAFEYIKAIPVPWAETSTIVRGPRRIPSVDTPYGRLGCVICYDMDFPTYIRQAGRADIDIVLAPSNDWKEIDPLHTHMAAFRAIENGFSLVRHTSNGLSMAVDYQGRTLSVMDHFTTSDRVMISHLPIKGTSTIYSRVGDVFGGISVAALFGLILTAVFRRKEK